MNPLEALSNIIKVRDELREMENKIQHLRRELDHNVNEVVEFMKLRRLIEVKK